MLYPNAPIREALFDIKIDRLNIKAVEDLLAIRDDLKDDFPIEKMRHNVLGVWLCPGAVSEIFFRGSIFFYSFTFDFVLFINSNGTRMIKLQSRT